MITLPGYQILNPIYNGSRTLVYRGIRLLDNLPVVIKLLRSEYPTLPELVEFRNQYTIAKHLNVPGIVPILSLEPYHNGFALVMEDNGYIPLADYLVDRELTLRESLQIAIEITQVLERLYQHRVIHKDVKIPNLLIHPETLSIQLIDFSISSFLNASDQELINHQRLEGTLAYMSPEQTGRTDRGIDYRTDLYSLGVTLYELFTRRLPFQSSDPLELVHSHLAKAPLPPVEIEPNLPLMINQIILKLMAKNPEERYQTPMGLRSDLEYCLEKWQTLGEIPQFILATQDVINRFILPAKLYGREEEIARLNIIFNEFLNASQNSKTIEEESGTSKLIVVKGQSGVGKSALIQELYPTLIQNQCYFISGKFDQLKYNTPFFGWVQAFQNLVQTILTEPESQIRNWKAKISEVLGDAKQIVIDVLPELKLLFEQPLLENPSYSQATPNQVNQLVQKLIRVFATSDHPLVIFLDDVQWADLESLRLIQALMSSDVNSQPSPQNLLLILAYRIEEVGRHHRLTQILEFLHNSGREIHIFHLENLDKTVINQWIGETLSPPNLGASFAYSEDRIEPLTELVQQQTQGNPFFIRQFLYSLYEEGLIWFHPPEQSSTHRNIPGGWQCDLAQIRRLVVSQDILELLLNQLQKLPQQTQDILKLAACLGNQFNSVNLTTIAENSHVETLNALENARQAKLIVFPKEIYPFYSLEDQEILDPDETLPLFQPTFYHYQFIHDRVQQAAYLLIRPEERQATHLKIGRLLLNSISQQQPRKAVEFVVAELPPEPLFSIINQFNLGVGLIREPRERYELALFNLIAGRKAKIATAYGTAIGHLVIGIGLLAQDCWQNYYHLALELYTEATEVAYLIGDFEQINDWGEFVLQNAHNLTDKAKIYALMIQAKIAQNLPEEAVTLALMVCEQLGVTFPTSNRLENWQQSQQQLIHDLEARSPLTLINLPPLLDENRLTLFQILVPAFGAAWNAIPQQFPFWVLHLVQLSIQEGNTPLSSLVYATYGFLLCGENQFNLGYEMGELALRLSAQGTDPLLKLKVSAIAYEGIKPWKEAVSEFLPSLQQCYIQAQEMGNLEEAYFLVTSYIKLAYFSGQELLDLEFEINQCLNFIQAFNDSSERQNLTIYYNSIQGLTGKIEIETALNFSLDSEPLTDRLNGMGFFQTELEFQLNLNKMILNYLFENVPLAWHHCQQAELSLDPRNQRILLPYFEFYRALVQARHYSQFSPDEQPAILDKISTCLTQLKTVSDAAPANFLPLFYLVKAELHRLQGEKVEAIETYEQAIASAKTYQLIQIEALANELTAQFYLAWDKEKIAKVYLMDAYYNYAHWGAVSKVKDLEARYPQLLSSILEAMIPPKTGTTLNTNTRETIVSSSSGGSAALDLATVIKASQALSEEIDLERLLRRFMQAVIENAGAEKCCILFPIAEELVIEGIAYLNPKTGNLVHIPSLLESIPLTANTDLPLSVINTVIRTQEFMILADARRQFRHRNDPYLLQQQPKSILCTPIQHRGKLIGILYLENNLATGVFTPERLEVLKILFSQAAISIDNAKLYTQVRNNERQMKQFLEGMPVGVAVLDATGKPHYINQKAQELLGTEILPGVPCRALTNIYQAYLDQIQANQSNLTELRSDLMNQNQETAFTLAVNQGDGKILLENWVIPTYDEAGGLVYTILAFQDITERQQTERALRAAEEKYRSIFENASEGLFQTTPNGRYISVNPALARILGYDSPQDLITTIKDVKTQLYVEYKRRDEFIQQINEQGEVSGFELKVYRKDGSIIWVSENARAVCGETGELLYYEGFVVDITERKKAEEERIQFMQQLSELNQHLDAALDSEFELTDAAGRFVPHEFLSCLGYESIVEVQLGAAVEKEMSILFADIRDFTGLSEGMTPEDNFKFINAFLSRMEPAIVENFGFIDKYIGDEIMALFGGSADDAVRAAIAMVANLNEYNETRQRPGRPAIKIGIGINTGGLMLGIVGGKNRLDSTVISDSVNVASRVENLTKHYGVSLLITQQTFMALGDANQYAIRIIDRVKVKGKSDAVTVYEVFDADLPQIKAGKLATKTTFEHGLLQFYLERYSEAAELLQNCLKQNPGDQVAQIYLERCLAKLSEV